MMKHFCFKKPLKQKNQKNQKKDKMTMILEKDGMKRCALEGTTQEIFTQKKFIDLILESHKNKQDYYLGRVITKKNNKSYFYCYDAKQLCKYIFEMIINSEGRKIKIKNFRDPIFKNQILELSFFKLKYDSDEPLKAEYVGNYKDFLESNILRSKIFFREDPFDALSVCFKLGKRRSLFLNRKKIFSFLMSLIFILFFVSGLIYLIERGYLYNDIEYDKNDIKK